MPRERSPVLEAHEYRWAGMKARVDSPSVADLLAAGWESRHVDPRYGTHLLRRRISNDSTGLILPARGRITP